ncbi:hypothetical protein GCM10010174_50130 [Kutzneria viridogrisea]
MWDEFVVHADGRLELWDVTLPWHGVDDPRWSHGEDQATALAEVLAGFDAVLAHSYTAGLLLEVFAEGLSPAVPSVLTNAFYRAGAEQFDWSTITYYLNDFHLIFAEALRWGPAARLTEQQRSKLALRLRDQIGPHGWVRFFATYLRSSTLDLSEVRAPQLVLSAACDIAARAEDGRALAQALPEGRFAELADCGHFPMLERPERFARLVSDFLSDAAGSWSPHTTDVACLELT